MARELPTIEHDGQVWTVDTSLCELRKQDKPYEDPIPIGDIEDPVLADKATDILYADLFDSLDCSTCK